MGTESDGKEKAQRAGLRLVVGVRLQNASAAHLFLRRGFEPVLRLRLSRHRCVAPRPAGFGFGVQNANDSGVVGVARLAAARRRFSRLSVEAQ